ncbi:cupredoxin domain-containing protein [Arthrobacter cheniae]|uniref:hypothetical protein n=1 Tax=Arthrobacter cheniae TaxID=1258888 RepID=UPI001601579F|nr:hypothetical protein [Arthrobacter cheniae]
MQMYVLAAQMHRVRPLRGIAGSAASNFVCKFPLLEGTSFDQDGQPAEVFST